MLRSTAAAVTCGDIVIEHTISVAVVGVNGARVLSEILGIFMLESRN